MPMAFVHAVYCKRRIVLGVERDFADGLAVDRNVVPCGAVVHGFRHKNLVVAVIVFVVCHIEEAVGIADGPSGTVGIHCINVIGRAYGHRAITGFRLGKNEKYRQRREPYNRKKNFSGHQIRTVSAQPSAK